MRKTYESGTTHFNRETLPCTFYGCGSIMCQENKAIDTQRLVNFQIRQNTYTDAIQSIYFVRRLSF